MLTLTATAAYPLLRLIEQGKLSRKDFEARALRVSRRIDQLEKRTSVSVNKLLRSLDREVRDQIIAATDADALSRSDINKIIDRAVDDFTTRRRTVTQQATQQAVDLAGDFRRDIAKIADQPAPTAPVPGKLAKQITDVQAETNDAFGRDIRNKLKAEVATGIADGKTPNQIAKDVASKRIVTPSRVKKDPVAHGALGQNEKLARTEIRQAFNLANQAQAKAESVTKPGILKTWITQMDAVVRVSHVDAMRKYAIGGRIGPIPIGQKFEVGGARLMFPADPSGPPEEIINCRCISVEIIPEVDEQISKAGGKFK